MVTFCQLCVKEMMMMMMMMTMAPWKRHCLLTTFTNYQSVVFYFTRYTVRKHWKWSWQFYYQYMQHIFVMWCENCVKIKIPIESQSNPFICLRQLESWIIKYKIKIIKLMLRLAPELPPDTYWHVFTAHCVYVIKSEIRQAGRGNR